MKLEASGDFADKEGALTFPMVSAPKLWVTFLFADSESSRVPTSTRKPAEKSGRGKANIHSAFGSPVPGISTCPKCGSQLGCLYPERLYFVCWVSQKQDCMVGRGVRG